MICFLYSCGPFYEMNKLFCKKNLLWNLGAIPQSRIGSLEPIAAASASASSSWSAPRRPMARRPRWAARRRRKRRRKRKIPWWAQPHLGAEIQIKILKCFFKFDFSSLLHFRRAAFYVELKYANFDSTNESAALPLRPINYSTQSHPLGTWSLSRVRHPCTKILLAISTSLMRKMFWDQYYKTIFAINELP